MAIIKKVKLPDGTTHDVNDARITGIDNTPVQNSTNVVTSGGLYTELLDVVHQGDLIGSATYEDSGTVVDLTDYVREDNLKTINNQSLLGSGNITISGGAGGEANVIESITYDGAIVPITNKTANIVSNSHLHVTIDTENFLWDSNTLIQTDFTRTSLASFLGITISEVQLLYQGKYDFIEAEIVFYEDGESFSETWVIPRFFRSQSVSEPDVVYGVGADSWYDIQFSCSNHTIENGNYQILIGNGGNLESSYESTFNKVYSLSSSSTHSEYPSAKCVYDAIAASGGGSGGGGEANVIEAITFNGASVPVTNKTAAITATIPAAVTESTVSNWGFTKNTGTYSKPSGGIPKTDLASAVQTSLGKADTALQSYTETDPTVPAWAKAATKPTYTAAEVGALPNTTVIPATTSALTNDSGFKKITISSSEPTSSDGVNGDIWIVI